MTILSPNTTNYVPFCGPCLLLRDKEQRTKEIPDLREGKRQRQKKKLERETADLLVFYL